MPRKRQRDQRGSPLCALPAEIRIIILKELVTSSRAVTMTGDTNTAGLDLAIMRTCQTLHSEALALFCAHNTVKVDIGYRKELIVLEADRAKYGAEATRFKQMRHWLSSKSGRFVRNNFRKIECHFIDLDPSSTCGGYRQCRYCSDPAKLPEMLEGAIRDMSQHTVFKTMEVSFAFCPWFTTQITDNNATVELRGIFELLRCKTLNIIGVNRQTIQTICERVEGDEDVIDLMGRAERYPHELLHARKLAHVELRDEPSSTAAAIAAIKRAATRFDIVAFSKNKRTLDARLHELQELVRNRSDPLDTQLQAFCDE